MGSQTSALQHHFRDLDQQYKSSSLGMWLFLVTEVMLFGGFILGYAIYRGMYPEGFAAASLHLSVFWGCFNTVVLLASSFTMVLAVHYAKQGDNKKTLLNLLLTIVFALIFFTVKGFEYYSKFKHHLIPGDHFEFHGFSGPGPEIFYSFYFSMTGLHAFHMIIGLVGLIVLAVKTARGRYSAEWNTPIDMFGLYWHLVDIVWIFLFPLLYLIQRHV